MPIGSDLVLHEQPDPAAVVVDGERLGKVIEETARRYNTPIAVSRMDLELEKAVLLKILGIPEADIPKYQFTSCPTDAQVASVGSGFRPGIHPKMDAHIDSIRYIAANTDLVPVGMTIGPFSLMTKLVRDPISPIYMAGMGLTAEEEPELEMVERVLEMGTRLILKSVSAQIDAGAKLVFIAEPAANKVYLSPNQIEKGSDIFDRYPMKYLKRIKAFLDERNVDLLFHCCGELIDVMVAKFTELRPVILSLGSSRILWEDAALVPKDIVLYGNLPSKRFYDDALISLEDVVRTSEDLLAKMREAGHPFILGSECDVLSVPGCQDTLMRKADAIAGLN
jgi:uroporphyrinogen-III decarboxylase